MISLNELSRKGKIEKTGAKPKLPISINGVSSSLLDVYRIPLSLLYYNDKNGRIATSMSALNYDLHPLSDIYDSEYNDFIANIIQKDSDNSISRTQKSIEKSGQQIYGYVLDDGRVIDGNRRFTALRNIQKNTGKSMFFEAVILPFSYDKKVDKVKIKRLELAIQMGVEEKRQYDSVDLAVDLYRTTHGNDSIMSLADYSHDSHINIKEATKILDGAIYMREFLEFIGTSKNNYEIIKENKIWSLFYEMGKTLRAHFGNDADSQVQKNETKNSYFAVILYQIKTGVVSGTTRTNIRNYGKSIVSNSNNDEFNEDVEYVVDDIADAIQNYNIDNTQSLNEFLNTNNELLNKFGDSYLDHMELAKNGASVDKFIDSVKESTSYFNKLNQSGGLSGNLRYSQFSYEQIKYLQKSMQELNLYSKELFVKYGDEIS